MIFSRAKRHMMVVSSIEGAQITNTYNMGANALRKYLAYAQAASVGDADAMAAALTEYSGADAREADGDGQLVADQIAEELTARGFVAVRNRAISPQMPCRGEAGRSGRGWRFSSGHPGRRPRPLRRRRPCRALRGEAGRSIRVRLGGDDRARQGLAHRPRQGHAAHCQAADKSRSETGHEADLHVP